MANLRDIKRRIRSIKNTRQITRAMQLVAASKMKRAQDQAVAGIPYAVFLADLLQSLTRGKQQVQHPLFEQRPVKRRGVLVISTDRGLCGPLNANLLRHLTQHHDRATHCYIAVGRKAVQFLSRSRRELVAEFTVDEKVQFRQIRMIAEYMVEQFTSGKVDAFDVLYPRFINTLVQRPTQIPLIPFSGLEDFLERMEEMRAMDAHIPERLPPEERDFDFEPSVEAILAELPALFVKQQLYQIALSSRASEHSARMVAMKTATDNASNLVDDLTLEYNKARQASITNEVLEIAAAAASVTTY